MTFSKIKFILVLILISSSIMFSQDFKTVKIGDAFWMAENLNVDKLQNNDGIPNVSSFSSWVGFDESKSRNNGFYTHSSYASVPPAWCWYENKIENGQVYGKLYNHYAVTDKRGLCPAGWHVPSSSEWLKLIQTLGGRTKAGKELKNWSGWENCGTNSSGFKALPGGVREADEYGRGKNGEFSSIGLAGYWWCTDTDVYGFAKAFKISYNHEAEIITGLKRLEGLSVRCVKD